MRAIEPLAMGSILWLSGSSRVQNLDMISDDGRSVDSGDWKRTPSQAPWDSSMRMELNHVNCSFASL